MSTEDSIIIELDNEKTERYTSNNNLNLKIIDESVKRSEGISDCKIKIYCSILAGGPQSTDKLKLGYMQCADQQWLLLVVATVLPYMLGRYQVDSPGATVLTSCNHNPYIAVHLPGVKAKMGKLYQL